jgi:diguanylate cyclase (GGDEF)-like protein
LHGLNVYKRVKFAVQARLRRAQRACEGAERGGGAPRATEPGFGAEPRLVLVRMPTHLLLPDQDEQLRALDAAVALAHDFEAACRLVVVSVAAILNAPVVLVDAGGAGFKVVCTAGSTSDDEAAAAMAKEARSAPTPEAGRVFEGGSGDASWTGLALEDRHAAGLLLMVHGRWPLSGPMLQDCAVRLGAALKRFAPARSRRNHGMAAVHTLPRRLVRATEPAQMHQMIVDACAVAVDAHKASLAIYDPERRSLSVTATHGYPASLVRHLRIRPGEGIIGSVFRTGRALRVDDIRRLDDAPPRLRYRTTSFISVPLTGSGHVLGVISVSDPRRAPQFSRRDLRTLRTMASIARLGLDRAKAIEQASAAVHAAAIDPLTGLFNRRHFLARLQEEVERAKRQSSPLTVMMLDVDNFKQLNDRYGHLMGDAVLRAVGDVLRRSVRLFDVCARHGGDEFAIMMPGSGPESGRQIAERIREGVEDARPAGGSWSAELRLTTSIGIASFANSTTEDLIDRADQALYAAKRQGKNRVRMGGEQAPDMHGLNPDL